MFKEHYGGILNRIVSGEFKQQLLGGFWFKRAGSYLLLFLFRNNTVPSTFDASLQSCQGIRGGDQAGPSSPDCLPDSSRIQTFWRGSEFFFKNLFG